MVRRFRFRLETVLKLRQRARDQQRRVVAEALRVVAQIETRMTQLTHQLHETIDQSRNVQQAGTLDVRFLSGQEFHRHWLGRKIMESQTELTQKRAEFEAERAKLADAWKKLRVIEKLREKQWQRHRTELTREERTLTDETALNVYLRKHDHQRDEVAA